MFYAHFVLSKKGPLARIWLAAHWDKKLTKAHVFETNIESSVEGILQPKVKMALRTSGHLLLGVVRIYSRKAKYLLADCNEAFIKIKMAFRPGVVDLPEENREAALNAITLPEVFHDFDTAMPDLTDVDVQAQFTLNQSRAEEITMREDYGNVTLVGDDGFGDMGFEDNEIVRDANSHLDDSLEHSSLLFGAKKDRAASDAANALTAGTSSSIDKHMDGMDIDAPLRDDGFGGGVGEGLLSAETGGLFEPGGLFDDAPMEHVPMDTSNVAADLMSKKSGHTPRPDEAKRGDESDDDDDYYGDMGPASIGCPSSGPSSPATPVVADGGIAGGAGGSGGVGDGGGGVGGGGPPVTAVSDVRGNGPVAAEQTTLIQNEEETFALAPLESSIFGGGGGGGVTEKTKAAKRKRKLIIDEVKNISGEEMKSQLADTTDIVTTLDLAPPTKRLMHWKETGGVEKLFALPGRPILSKTLSKLYQRHLTTRAVENEDIGLLAANDAMEIVEPAAAAAPPEIAVEPEDETMRSARKRKHSEIDEQAIDEHDPSHLNEQQQDLEMSRVLPPVVGEDPLMASPPMHQQQQQQLPPPPPIEQVPLTPRPLSPTLPQQPPESNHHLIGDPSSSVFPPPVMESESFGQIPPLVEEQAEVQTIPAELSTSVTTMNQQQQQPQQQQLPEDDFFSQTNVPLTATAAGISSAAGPLTMNHEHQTSMRVQQQHQQPNTPGYMAEDDDDMGCPASVGPPDEQGADETYEQYEERVLNKRAQQMLFVIQRQFQRQNSLKFSDLARNLTRKQVAQKFYTFLVLKKQQAVELHQDGAFTELYITRGPKLDTLY